MIRVCAWCNTVLEGPRVTGVAADDPVSHSMCRLCAIEHYFYTLMKKGCSHLLHLVGR